MFIDDGIRLRHMQQAAKEAMSFADGRTKDDLKSDRQLALSIVKCVEIIGEAASRITDATRQAHPEIPWTAIVGMRNRLIHGYFDIDLERVWGTVTKNLPRLVESLDPLIRGLDSA